MKKTNENIISVIASMCATLTLSYSVASSASDIDIYAQNDAGTTTITLMLDTSGSMSVSQAGASACELASGTTYTAGNEPSETTPGYTKYYCEIESNTQTKYFFRMIRRASDNRRPRITETWYNCKSDGSSVTSKGDCTYNTSRTAPNLSGYTTDELCNNTRRDTTRTCYYYENKPTTKYYDRLTRLKDAIFTLMDSDQIDSDSVAIGIGQFSSQSGSDNVYTSADGRSGKIVVPAALLSTTQRTAIKTAVANLIGSNGTPTANAYAEVGAYMLGTNTTTNDIVREEYISYNSGGSTRYGRCTEWRGLECWAYSTSTYLTSIGGRSTRQVTWSNASDIRTALLEPYLGYSGFSKSVNGSKVDSSATATNYQTPLSTTSTQCNGQGIYFLTDGEPNSSPVPEPLMKAALGTSGSSFSVPTTGTLPNGSQAGHGMPAVGEFAKALRDKTKNPLGLEIKTAVVGFGLEFNVNRTADAAKPVADRIIRTLDYINSRGERTNEQRDYYNCSLITNEDAQNACNWGAKSHPDLPSSVGGFGEGGFYSAQSTDDVVQSIVKFLDEVKPEFDPIPTGSPTVPIDALNPIEYKPYGYYASFIPRPQDSVQLWVGNLNKYDIYDGQLGDKNGENFTRLIYASGSNAGQMNSNVGGHWDGGVRAQIPLGTLVVEGAPKPRRKVFTDRKIVNDDNVIVQSNELTKVNFTTLLDGDDTTGKLINDSQRNYWLNVLGYNVAATAVINAVDELPAQEVRTLGSVMHSQPILLTQEGKIEYIDGELTTTGRKDYLLFGSTQGILHVVDDDGEEVLAFVPSKLMSNQAAGFLGGDQTTDGKNNLYYGVDAPWTSHTQYVRKTDGTLTVKSTTRTIDDEEIDSSGLQWVYGGLRMGGSDYYALDLTDIDDPELKFHIDPEMGLIFNEDHENGQSVEALQYMGQSWSKPTIGYVNFGGEKKLVMFVGGGYDDGYEVPNYEQDNQVGAGVYMFDANNGDLLWWSSANATSAMGADASTQNDDLKYSVVSQINAIDRDSDGLIDNLYFGDLGGQVFRVDLNNFVTSESNFNTRVVRLYNGNLPDGESPRFYEIPSFSVHDGVDGLYAAISLSSGNRSSPLAGVSGSNNATASASAEDGIFVIFDNDVGRPGLLKTNLVLRTPAAGSLAELVFLEGVEQKNATGEYNLGWKSTFGGGAGARKGMNGLYAVDGLLFANVYYRDGAGIGGDCGAGVKGDTYIHQYCLPTGRCSFYTVGSEGSTGTTEPNKAFAGAGILGGALGGDGSVMRNILPREDGFCDDDANANHPACNRWGTEPKLKQLRWYESR